VSARRRQGQNRRGRGRPQKSVDLWRPAPELPELEPITPVDDATALVRSLGEPPLYRHGEAAEQYVAAVVERAAAVATALAFSSGVLASSDEAD
jgi:hypothetical protein